MYFHLSASYPMILHSLSRFRCIVTHPQSRRICALSNSCQPRVFIVLSCLKCIHPPLRVCIRCLFWHEIFQEASMCNDEYKLFWSLPELLSHPPRSRFKCFRRWSPTTLFAIPICRYLAKVEFSVAELGFEDRNVGAGVAGPAICLLKF